MRDTTKECTCPNNMDYAAGPSHVCAEKPDARTAADGWEARFDTKWFETEKVSQTLNQHRWLMKDFIRAELSQARAQAASEAAGKVREAAEKRWHDMDAPTESATLVEAVREAEKEIKKGYGV